MCRCLLLPGMSHLDMLMQDIMKRYEQLNSWTAGNISTPHSVWLPGLFNPKVCFSFSAYLGGLPLNVAPKPKSC